MTNNQSTPWTVSDFIAFGVARHGENWKTLLPPEIGWSYWHINRVANGKLPVSFKLQRDCKRLKPRKVKL